MVISERLGMSVSCWVVGVSRVLPSVAKHHCFAPMVRFPWGVGGTSASPRVWRPAAGAMRGGGGEASSRPAHVHIQREFTWHSCVAERRLVSRSSSSPSFEEVISEFIQPHRFPAGARSLLLPRLPQWRGSGPGRWVLS